MRRRVAALVVFCALANVPLGATAQPAAGDGQRLLGLRLFNQSCRVCHTKPTLLKRHYGPVLSMKTLGGNADAIMRLSSATERRACRASNTTSRRRRSTPSSPTSKPFRHPRRPPQLPPSPPTHPAPTSKLETPMRTTRSLILANLRDTRSARCGRARIFADALLSGTDQIVRRQADGRRHSLGQSPTAAPSPPPCSPTKPGDIIFPHCRPGHYRVWAQALSYKTAKGEVDLSANRETGLLAQPDERRRGARSNNCPATSCSTRCRKRTPEQRG